MQEGDPILGGDANNVSGGQTPENGNVPSLSDTNSDSTAKDIDAALSSVTTPDSSESSDSSDPSELKISHNDSPTPPPVHILGQDITGITDEDFTPLSSNPEPTPQIIMPSGSPEVPAEPTAPEASTSPQTNASSSTGAIPTAPNSTSTQAPGAETSGTPTVTTSAAAIPLQTASQPIAATAPAPVQPESPAPNSNYAAEFKQSVKASVSGESGDIILSKDPKDPKKTRKGLIIGIVIALIVVVGLCAGLGVVLSSNQKNNLNTVANTSSKPSQEAIDSFYSYANEIIYGIDSTNRLAGEFTDVDNYAFEKEIYNSVDANKDYFNQIYDKYNDFYSKLATLTESSEGNLITKFTSEYKQLLDFLKANPTSLDFSRNQIISTYLEKGKDAAIEESDNILNDIPDDNIYAQDFYNLKLDEFSKTIEYVDLLYVNGCIINDEINTSCSENISYEDDEINLEQSIHDDNVAAYDLINNYYYWIGTKCWHIRDALEGRYIE